MRRIIGLFAAALFIGGLAHAEAPEGRTGADTYRLYSATNVPLGANQVRSGSGYLYKVIVSSPGNGSSASVDFYDSNGSNANKKFTIQVDTTSMTGAQEFTFGIAISSGLRTVFSTSAAAGYGSVQAIYSPGVQQNYRVWQSSFMPVDSSTHVISNRRVLLHKVIVLKKGAGTSVLGFYNQRSTTTSLANRKFNLDLTDGVKEYTLNAMFPDGLVVMAPSAGTTAAEYILLYKQNPPLDWDYWNVYHATFAVTNQAIFAGRGVFGGVVNGDISATGNLKAYNSNGTANTQITEIDGDTQFSRRMFDVNVSSGLTITTVGPGEFSVLWRRLR